MRLTTVTMEVVPFVRQDPTKMEVVINDAGTATLPPSGHDLAADEVDILRGV